MENLLEEFLEAKQEAKLAEARVKRVQAEVAALMEDAEHAVCDGVTVLRYGNQEINHKPREGYCETRRTMRLLKASEAFRRDPLPKA